MMLVLTSGDIEQLSPEFRAELQRLLFDRKYEEQLFIDDETERDRGFYSEGSSLQPGYIGTPEDSATERKRVIDITPAEAAGVIANISDRSLQTLKLFAEDRPIPLAELVGDDRPYENMTDLKRSFVGAITRRLRTVTSNKQAALFLKCRANDCLDGENAIAVRPSSARALRTALGFPEPSTGED
jgi:hypothetical protein